MIRPVVLVQENIMENENIDKILFNKNSEMFFKKFPDFYCAYKDHNEILNKILFHNDSIKDCMPLCNSEWIGLFNCGCFNLDTDMVLLNLHDSIKYIFDASVFIQLSNFKKYNYIINMSDIKRVVISNQDIYNKLKNTKFDKHLDISNIEFYNKNSIGESVIDCKVGDMVKFKDSNGIRSYDVGIVTDVQENIIIIIFKNGYKLKMRKDDIGFISKLIKL